MPFRGGAWNNGSSAGVFAFNVKWTRSNSSHDVGFRSALLQSKTGIRLKVMPFRGGAFNGSQTQAGVFALNLNNPRSYSNLNRGFRSALTRIQRAKGIGL